MSRSSMARFLACCVTHAETGRAVAPPTCTRLVETLDEEQDVEKLGAVLRQEMIVPELSDCVLIVENQLTATDHSHLGQLMTYAAGTDAATIVWMATDFRDEHRQALDWLNDLSQGNARFFGIEIGAVRIADSPPAPLFKLRAQPNDWHAVVSTAAKATSERGAKAEAYRAFWGLFIERVHAEHQGWTNARTPSANNWFDMKSLIKGAHYSVSFAMNGRTRSELYIDSGDEEENLALLERFESQRT